jgi:hypothetical protein
VERVAGAGEDERADRGVDAPAGKRRGNLIH